MNEFTSQYLKRREELSGRQSGFTPAVIPLPTFSNAVTFQQRTKERTPSAPEPERVSLFRNDLLSKVSEKRVPDLSTRLRIRSESDAMRAEDLTRERRDILGFNPAPTQEQRDRVAEIDREREALRQRSGQLREDARWAEYGQLRYRPDFAANSSRPRSTLDDTRRRAGGEAVDERYLVGLEHSGYVGSMEWIERARQLTDEELAVYNYLRNTEGQESADAYLDLMEETLNQRVGGKQAEAVSGIENPLLRTAATGLYAVGSGLDQFGTGVQQLFTEKALPTTATQFGAAQVREDLADASPSIGGKPLVLPGGASLGQAAFDLVSSAANMAPGLALSAATAGAGAAPWLSGLAASGSLGASSGGNAYNEAVKQGYTPAQARSYAILTGASEGGLQYLLGGIGALGGRVSRNVIQNTVKNIDNALLRAGAELGLNMLSEGAEEYLQEVLTPVFRNIALDENNPVELVSEEAIYAGILGALSAGAFEGPGQVSGAISDARTDRSIDRAYSGMMESGIAGFTPGTSSRARSTGQYGTSTSDAWYNRNADVQLLPNRETEAAPAPDPEQARRPSPLSKDEAERPNRIFAKTPPETARDGGLTLPTASGAGAAAPRGDVRELTLPGGEEIPISQRTQLDAESGIKVYRGSNRSKNPLERNLAKKRTVFDVIGKGGQEVELVPLEYYTSSYDDAQRYANHDRDFFEAQLIPSARMDYKRKLIEGKDPGLPEDEWVRNRAEESYRILMGRDPVFDGGSVDEYTIHPQKVLDLSEAGEQATINEIYNVLSRQTGISHTELDDALLLLGVSDEAADGGPVNVYNILRNNGNHVGTRFYNWMRQNGFDAVKYLESGAEHYAIDRSVSPIRQQAENHAAASPEPLPVLDQVQAGEGGGAERGGFGENTVGAAENPYGYQQRQSRVGSNTFSKMYQEVLESMEQDGGNVTDLPYDVVTERQSMEHAQQRLSTDLEGEIADLPQKDAWSGEDLDTAMGILDRYMAEAKESRDYTKVNEWARLIQAKGTSGGQFIQAFAKYSRTPQGILVDAVKALDNSRLNEQRKNQVMDHVRAQVEALDSLQDGDKQSVIDLIRENSKIRRTGTLFRNRISVPLEQALRADSFEHLKKVAAAQVDSIAKDYERQSTAGRVRDLRSMFMLSNVATTIRNLLGNGAFGGLDAFAGSTGGVPLDILLSKFTGTRSVAVENPVSLTALKGMRDGALKSYIEVALDADPSGIESRYGTTSKRSFKMTGSPLERFLSTWSKYMGYALNTTDEMAKGGARASVQRGIDRLTERGLVRDDSLSTRADEIAKYRTFQDDTALSKGMRGVRNALNYAGVGPARGGSPHSFGAGDILMPFDRVPANLVSRSLEYSPLGLANGARKVANVLWNAHKGTLTAAEQARAVSAVSRGMTGTGLIALFALLASAGLLRVAGNREGEEDKTALETSEGLSETQLNLSGFLRWVEAGNLPKLLPGGEAPDPIEWRDGDEIMSIGFLDPINAQMTTGALLAQGLKENPEADRLGTFGMASLEGTLQSLLDLPAMSSLQALANGYNYSDADTTGGRVGDALISYGASQVSSFIPNIVRAAARAGDPYVRDTYSSGTPIGEMVDSIKAGIPGLRQTLPIRQTPFGADRTYGDNQTMNALNAMLMPGVLTTYRTSDAAQELYGLPSVDDNPIYPRRNAPNTVSFNGNDYELTPEQKTQYQKTYGQTYQQLIDELRVSSYYKGLDPEDQTRLLSDARAYANDKAKREALEANGVDYQSSNWEKAYRAEQAGVPMEAYFTYRARRNELEDSADKEAARSANATIRREIMDDSSLTDAQKSALDRYLLNDITVIPKDMNVDYSSEESFLISQMSDSAQRRWPGIRDRFGITAEEYQEAVRIYNMDKDDGVTTADKKRMLRELFGQYGNAIYKALGEKIEDDED